MDSKALMIHLGLPAGSFNHEAICDELGILALVAITECEKESVAYMRQFPYHSIPLSQMKTAMREISTHVGAKYKARAKELGGDLLTLMEV